jgi:TPR repeat protein
VKAWVGVQEIGSRASSAFRAGLDSKDVKVRDAVRYYLGHITGRKYQTETFWKKWMDEQAMLSMDDLLKVCREEKDAEKVNMATAALALYYTEKAPAKLVELIVSEKWKRGDRLAIFGVYALDPIENRLRKERHAEVRVRLTKHLGKLYDPRTLEVIEVALNDPSGEVRTQAVVELEHIIMYNPAAAEASVRVILKTLGNPNLTVVTAARRALELKSARTIVERLARRYGSAKPSDTHSMIMMGRMYEHGAGVPKDRKKALEYFNTARKKGDPEGKKEYDRLRLLVER